MEYIGGPPQPGCLFCRVLQAPPAEDRANLVLWRPGDAVVLLNRYPYNPGHLMVAPARHDGDLAALSPESSGALFSALQRSLRVLESVLTPGGFNVGANLGRAAGAGIPDHAHLHVVPRWDGDTNFMPVLSEVKVVNEHLDRTWEKLSDAFAAS
jgi:ATP adenylyltransferase